MRIISGIHKGRKLIAPKNLPVRPTTDRAKEALFNILENRYYFENKNVLDLFAGTGNIGYEFASRGCKDIIAIDKNKSCINYIQKTASTLGININAILDDSLEYITKCNKQFDFIFVDPPYNYPNYQDIKKNILEKKIIKKNGCLIIEHDKNTIFLDQHLDHRKYGNIHFSIFSF